MKREDVVREFHGRRNVSGMRYLWLVAGMLAVVPVLSYPAFAEAEYDSSITYYQDGQYVSIDSDGSDDSHVSYQSFSGGVGSGWSVNNGESFALTTGRANAANLSLGVSAQVYSTPANTHFSDARISTSVSNRLTIAPGSSGLSPGDVVLLSITLRLDGAMHAEALSWPGSGWSHAEMSAGLSVHDYAIQIDLGGDGFWSPSQASFGASCELEAYDVYMPFWQYSYSSNWSESWRTESNISPETYHSNSGSTIELGESFHYQAGRSFNTGELTLLFEAIVGHTLDFEAEMYLYIGTNHDAMTWADFNNTFAFDVASTVDGLSLNWAVVPEPASLALLAAGSLALLRRRTR